MTLRERSDVSGRTRLFSIVARCFSGLTVVVMVQTCHHVSDLILHLLRDQLLVII